MERPRSQGTRVNSHRFSTPTRRQPLAFTACSMRSSCHSCPFFEGTLRGDVSHGGLLSGRGRTRTCSLARSNSPTPLSSKARPFPPAPAAFPTAGAGRGRVRTVGRGRRRAARSQEHLTSCDADADSPEPPDSAGFEQPRRVLGRGSARRTAGLSAAAPRRPWPRAHHLHAPPALASPACAHRCCYASPGPATELRIQ